MLLLVSPHLVGAVLGAQVNLHVHSARKLS